MHINDVCGGRATLRWWWMVLVVIFS